MARHHYVPQFYLKFFKVPGSRASIIYYERNKEPVLRNTLTVAFKKDYYSYIDSKTGAPTDELEKTYSQIESVAKPVFDKLIADQDAKLTDKEWGNFIYFITHLHTRNTAFRTRSMLSTKVAAKRMMQLKAEDKDGFYKTLRKVSKGKVPESKFESYRQTFLKQNYDLGFDDETRFLGEALRLAQDAYFLMYKRKYYFLKATTGKSFITSDNPLNVHFDSSFEELHGNGGLLTSVLSLPITPELTLIIDDSDRKKRVTEASSELVDQLNFRQSVLAVEGVFSHLVSQETAGVLNRTKPGDGQAIEVTFGGKTDVYHP